MELRDEPGHTVPLMQDKSKGELRDEPGHTVSLMQD